MWGVSLRGEWRAIHTRETQHIAFKTKHGAGGASLLGGGGGHSGNLSLAAYKEIDQII